MKHHILRGGSAFVCLLAGAVAALGQAPSGVALSASGKIALIDMNTAISRTQEGQQRAKELEVKFVPRVRGLNKNSRKSPTCGTSSVVEATR